MHKSIFYHIMNPLHIYCRLIDCGIPKKFSYKICFTYEKVIFKRFLKWRRKKIGT